MRSKITFRHSAYSSQNNLTPIAGVLLALASLLLLTYYPPEHRRGLVPIGETPRVIGNVCFSVHTTSETIISLAADGQVSFAVTDSTLQAAVLGQVGKVHGVTFTTLQAGTLGNLPYLSTSIDELPGLLTSSSAITHQALLSAQQKATLDYSQLVECVGYTKVLAPVLTGYPTSFFLAINAETDASKVMHLISMLQDQGINRFNLLAHDN
jgi:biopolymer transport protein ExbD